MSAIRNKEQVRVLFCSDATGSMSTYLHSIQQILPQMVRVSELTNSIEEVGIFLYRDYCDRQSIQFEWTGWKKNANELMGFIANSKADGGGDTPEAVRGATHRLRKPLQEGQNNLPTLIIWYADAPPHEPSHSLEKEMLGANFDWIQCCSFDSKVSVCPIITQCMNNELYFGTLAERTIGIGLVSPLFNGSPLQIASASLAVLANFIGLEPPVVSAKIAQLRVADALKFKVEDEMHKSGNLERSSVLHYPPPGIHIQTKDLLDAFNHDEAYREQVYSTFASLVCDQFGVISLSQLPFLGKIWRLIQRRRLDERRVNLITEIGRTLSKITDEAARQAISEWIASSYDYSEDIIDAITKCPSQVPAFVCDVASGMTRSELLEIGRSTDPKVLERVSQLLSHLQVVNQVPNASYLPASLNDDDIFMFLPHIMFPGTWFSRRLAILMAILAVRQKNIHLAERAERFIINSRGKWLIREEIEDNTASFLEFVLRSPVDPFTPEERAFISKQFRIYGMSACASKVVDVITLDPPRLQDLTPCSTVQCMKCKQERSTTIMTVDCVCGVCLSRLKPLEAEEPGKCHLVTCRKCLGVYEVVNVHLLKSKPKCHYCRLNQPVIKAECINCHVLFNDPTRKFQDMQYTCHRCTKSDSARGKIHQHSISELITDQVFRRAILSRLEIPDIDYSTPFYRISNRFFYLPTPQPTANITDIRVHKKIVANIFHLFGCIEKLVLEGQREKNECMLCFEEVPKDTLIPTCGRRDCDKVACRQCISKWYGFARPGDTISLSNLACPFCRRPPVLKTMRQFNRRALAINFQTAEFDPAFHYAWCSGTCYRPVPTVRKDCEMEPPNYGGVFVCDVCQTQATAIASLPQPSRPIRESPCCHVMVEKVGGCDHMTCNCGQHWCWECLVVIDPEEIYDHLALHRNVFVDDDDDE